MKTLFLLLFLFTALAPVAQASKNPRKAFYDSWRFYEWRVEQGDDLVELESILQRILKKYRGKPVNLAKVRRELTRVRAVRAAASESGPLP